MTSVHKVLLPLLQRPKAHGAVEAGQVVDVVLDSHHHILGHDPLRAPGTLNAEYPARKGAKRKYYRAAFYVTAGVGR